MKAKEYVEQFFSKIEANTTGVELFDMASKCFMAFNTEMVDALKSVVSGTSKIAKLKEFRKKWIAVCSLVDKRVKESFGLQVGDGAIFDVIQGLFDGYFLKYYPDVHQSIVENKPDEKFLDKRAYATQDELPAVVGLTPFQAKFQLAFAKLFK